MANSREIRPVTFSQLHANVEAKLPRALACDPLIVRQVIGAVVEELGLVVDEASGEIVAKPYKPDWAAPEDNYRKSVRVPGRRR